MAVSSSRFALLSLLSLGQTLAWQHQTSSAFNATAYNGLMACVQNISRPYEVAVHYGTVVIIPPENEYIDLDGDDAALEDCMLSYSSYVDMAVDDSRSALDDGAVAATMSQATAAWAEQHGAAGMTMREGDLIIANDTAHAPSMLARQVTKNYFFSLGTKVYSDCSNYDQQNNVLNECINFGEPYRSLYFANPNNYNSIRVRRWPHHKCAVDYNPSGKDGRSLVVAPGAYTDCLNYPKQTFSWLGKLIPRNCFGTCQ